MPLSRYLKIYPCPDQPGFSILYSTIKSSIIRVPDAFVEAAESGQLSPSDQATLARLQMHVENHAEERERMLNIISKTNQKKNRFNGIVVLNLDCNLDCVYCYERDFRAGSYMTEATAELLVETVARDHIAQGREVSLKFYGGEPLLSLPLLQLIAARIKEKADQAGVPFSFGMVTNGTLLDRSTVEQLLPLGFTSAQLTLDGPRELHDSQRPFSSGAGSYATILRNIEEIYRLVTLKLGGNYSRDNYRQFPLMLDALLEAGVAPADLDPIQFSPILPKSSATNSSVELAAHCTSSSEAWLYDAALYLREETLKRGFAVLKTLMAACVVEMEQDLVITQDGTLYKCPSFMGWPELAVGTLKDGVKEYHASHNLGVWKNDTCLDCAYLPICFGGCRLMPLLRHGAIDSVDCRKGFYDACLEQIVRQDLNYRK